MALEIKEPIEQRSGDEQNYVTLLTDEQLNAKIAKILGWKANNHRSWWHDDYGDGPPPNYCLDLNAMHQAESILDCGFYPFSEALIQTCGYPDRYWHATARQHAEAFAITRDSQGESWP